jgi:hypothetical protein
MSSSSSSSSSSCSNSKEKLEVPARTLRTRRSFVCPPCCLNVLQSCAKPCVSH